MSRIIHSANIASPFIAKSKMIIDFGLLILLGVQKQTVCLSLTVWKERNKKSKNKNKSGWNPKGWHAPHFKPGAVPLAVLNHVSLFLCIQSIRKSFFHSHTSLPHHLHTSSYRAGGVEVCLHSQVIWLFPALSRTVISKTIFVWALCTRLQYIHLKV